MLFTPKYFLLPRSKLLSDLIYQKGVLPLPTYPTLTKLSGQRQSRNHLNATNSPNFLKPDFSFPPHCLPLKESLNPSGQSDNNLTIVDQVIVLGALVLFLG